ncbi:MAG: SusC/RagA family TonB-linked outer membrane protein [Gemmatimonadaceae bacterium]
MTLLFSAAGVLQAQATGIIRGRVLETGTNRPVTAAQVAVEGTRFVGLTNDQGAFSIAGVRPGTYRVTARRLGYEPRSASVAVVAGQSASVDLSLEKTALSLDAIVVTALGQTTEQRALGTATQTVQGVEIAQTQRENFVNALQGRVAGVNVTSSSGVPGASAMITIRGISSISGSNQPLFIIDGLPMDNKTLNTGVFVSDQNSNTMFANRGVDFTNRAADLNPEDIETLTVLKGPEASALYGIDAANGAIVITTKRGKAGTGGLEYNNSFRLESTRARPQIQTKYSVSGTQNGAFAYFGAPYPSETAFYDNVDGFFQTALTQKHNLVFSGAATDGRLNYRVSSAIIRQNGVIPGSRYDRVNLTGASKGQPNKWLGVDLSMTYSNSTNRQALKGAGGPLLALLAWPITDRASDWLTPAGTRRRVTTLSQGSEIDNPYFSVNKNKLDSKNNRVLANLGFILTPFTWGSLRSNLGVDYYTNQNLIVRHPESASGFSSNGIMDVADDITRNLNAQTILNLNSHPLIKGLSISGLLGNAVSDAKSNVDALQGVNFLDPNFVSVNNALTRASRTTISQRRLVSVFGQATLEYNRYLYLTATGRNDWTSTIPKGANSFFYPSYSASFIATDAFPSLQKFVNTAKLRAAYAEVGKDAAPYSYAASLEAKTTAGGGYGYGFWGPNPNLRPEFAKSREVGVELGFLDDRLGLDITTYSKRTENQIVQNIRGSYGTGFVLFNLNGASTKNWGTELSLRGTPVLGKAFSWDVLLNWDRMRSEVTAIPNALPESYVSDTWLYGNVRSGVTVGYPTTALTGRFYLRNKAGQLLIDPGSGLPIVSTGFIQGGYDRQPKWTAGLTNTLRYNRASLSFLLDFRRGGDVFNATEHWLTARGLATSTLDRETPRVLNGVLRDGRENTANPTKNTIVVVPAVSTGYYTNMSEELFIEKNINWVRLRDVTLNYQLPTRVATNASVFITATDLAIWTNYTGLDPVVNGNTAAVGGSSGMGIDYGNFPMPRGINFGLKMGF